MKKIVLLIIFIVLVSAVPAFADPLFDQLLYSTRTTLPPGTYTLRFSIWSDVKKGTMVWSETHTMTLLGQTISDYLGNSIPLPDIDYNLPWYVQVDTVDGTKYKPINKVRDKLGVAPYALSASVPLVLTGSGSGDGIIIGYNTSPSGTAIIGHATATGSATNYGGSFRADGNTGIGVFGRATGSNAVAVYGHATGTQGSGVFGYGPGTSGIGVIGNGTAFDFYASGPGTNYGYASSVRWKKNIVEIEDALGKVTNLRGVYFDWDEEHGGKHDMGFIAEEVGKVIPEVVGFEPDGVYAKGVDYGAITPMLVQAIKEQQEQIEQLKAQIEELKAKAIGK